MLGTAVGDPLGGCCVTPYGYSIMLEKASVQFFPILDLFLNHHKGSLFVECCCISDIQLVPKLKN